MDTITRIIARHIEQPREIASGMLLSDLGIICEAHLLSLQCDIEEQIVGAELPHQAVKADMTVADLVALVEREGAGV
jgi:hypothetical protein